jgi:hypothetical protein
MLYEYGSLPSRLYRQKDVVDKLALGPEMNFRGVVRSGGAEQVEQKESADAMMARVKLDRQFVSGAARRRRRAVQVLEQLDLGHPVQVPGGGALVGFRLFRGARLRYDGALPGAGLSGSNNGRQLDQISSRIQALEEEGSDSSGDEYVAPEGGAAPSRPREPVVLLSPINISTQLSMDHPAWLGKGRSANHAESFVTIQAPFLSHRVGPVKGIATGCPLRVLPAAMATAMVRTTGLSRTPISPPDYRLPSGGGLAEMSIRDADPATEGNATQRVKFPSKQSHSQARWKEGPRGVSHSWYRELGGTEELRAAKAWVEALERAREQLQVKQRLLREASAGPDKEVQLKRLHYLVEDVRLRQQWLLDKEAAVQRRGYQGVREAALPSPARKAVTTVSIPSEANQIGKMVHRDAGNTGSRFVRSKSSPDASATYNGTSLTAAFGQGVGTATNSRMRIEFSDQDGDSSPEREAKSSFRVLPAQSVDQAPDIFLPDREGPAVTRQSLGSRSKAHAGVTYREDALLLEESRPAVSQRRHNGNVRYEFVDEDIDITDPLVSSTHALGGEPVVRRARRLTLPPAPVASVAEKGGNAALSRSSRQPGSMGEATWHDYVSAPLEIYPPTANFGVIRAGMEYVFPVQVRNTRGFPRRATVRQLYWEGSLPNAPVLRARLPHEPIPGGKRFDVCLVLMASSVGTFEGVCDLEAEGEDCVFRIEIRAVVLSKHQFAVEVCKVTGMDPAMLEAAAETGRPIDMDTAKDTVMTAGHAARTIGERSRVDATATPSSPGPSSAAGRLRHRLASTSTDLDEVGFSATHLSPRPALARHGSIDPQAERLTESSRMLADTSRGDSIRSHVRLAQESSDVASEDSRDDAMERFGLLADGRHEEQVGATTSGMPDPAVTARARASHKPGHNRHGRLLAVAGSILRDHPDAEEETPAAETSDQSEQEPVIADTAEDLPPAKLPGTLLPVGTRTTLHVPDAQDNADGSLHQHAHPLKAVAVQTRQRGIGSNTPFFDKTIMRGALSDQAGKLQQPVIDTLQRVPGRAREDVGFFPACVIPGKTSVHVVPIVPAGVGPPVEFIPRCLPRSNGPETLPTVELADKDSRSFRGPLGEAQLASDELSRRAGLDMGKIDIFAEKRRKVVSRDSTNRPPSSHPNLPPLEPAGRQSSGQVLSGPMEEIKRFTRRHYGQVYWGDQSVIGQNLHGDDLASDSDDEAADLGAELSDQPSQGPLHKPEGPVEGTVKRVRVVG